MDIEVCSNNRRPSYRIRNSLFRIESFQRGKMLLILATFLISTKLVDTLSAKSSRNYPNRTEKVGDGGNFILSFPKFNSVCSLLNETLLYNFTYTMNTYPIGGILLFYVNHRSVDTFRFYNNTCYNKNSACSGDVCSCSYNEKTFRWWHRANRSNMPKTFELEMKFATFQLGRVKLLSALVYNNTAILETNSYVQSVEFPLFNWNRTDKCPNDLPTKPEFCITFEVIGIALMAIGILLILYALTAYFIRKKVSGCHGCCSSSKGKHDPVFL